MQINDDDDDEVQRHNQYTTKPNTRFVVVVVVVVYRMESSHSRRNLWSRYDLLAYVLRQHGVLCGVKWCKFVALFK